MRLEFEDAAIDKNAWLYYQTAVKLLLPVERVEEIDGFAITLAKKRYFFRGGETPFNNSCSATISLNKYSMNKVLEAGGIPVPKAVAVHLSEFENGDLEEKISTLKFPLVAKPTKQGAQGKDVLCNIQNLVQLKAYLKENFQYYPYLTIEEFHGGLKSYRVLVFRNRVIGVICRYPAQVVGDGIHSIQELVPLTNLKRKALNDALGNIVLDEEAYIKLNELQLRVDYIPRKGERVFLGYTSNASRGGTFESLGKQIAKANSHLMIRAAQLLNLELVGIDVECVDINTPIAESSGVIIEMNHCPSIKIHEIPMRGPLNPVTKTIITSLIYRHPLAYLGLLYSHKKSRFFTRSFLLLILLGFLSKLLI